jgi:hypothetical protein
MHESIQTHFKDLEEAVRSTAVPPERQEVIAGLVRRLPALYTKFRETNDSRCGDEISRVVQAVLKDLEACPQARKLDAAFRAKLWLLHEELGVPKLTLKAAPPPPSPKKTRTKK